MDEENEYQRGAVMAEIGGLDITLKRYHWQFTVFFHLTQSNLMWVSFQRQNLP